MSTCLESPYDGPYLSTTRSIFPVWLQDPGSGGALGGALEIYDFIIFVLFALTLSQLFFPPEMPEWLRLLQSFGIFVTGYLARPLGGILMAHFADRVGRKRRVQSEHSDDGLALPADRDHVDL